MAKASRKLPGRTGLVDLCVQSLEACYRHYCDEGLPVDTRSAIWLAVNKALPAKLKMECRSRAIAAGNDVNDFSDVESQFREHVNVRDKAEEDRQARADKGSPHARPVRPSTSPGYNSAGPGVSPKATPKPIARRARG